MHSSTFGLPALPRAQSPLFVILAALCFFLLVTPVQAKLVFGTARLQSEVTEWYLGKFAFAASQDGQIFGTLVPEIDVKTGKPRRYFDSMPHSLAISFYDDEAWERLEALNKKGALCTERIAVATFSSSLRSHSYGGDQAGQLQFRHGVPSRLNSHYVYALLSDCALENYPARPPGLDYKVTFLNGDSHLPADEQHMLSLLICMLVAVIVAGGVYSFLLYSQNSQFSQVHLSSLLVGAALALQFIAIVAQIAHVVKYQSDGLGYKLRYTWLALDFLSEITQLTSELIVAFVLICLSAGWMLSESFHVSRILFDKRAMGLLAGLAGLHLWLQYKGRVYENDFNHFHDFDHWPGLLLICLRAFLCVVFWLGMALSYGVTPEFVRRSPAFKFIFTVLGVVQKQRSSAAMAATASAFSPASGGAGAGQAGVSPLMGGAGAGVGTGVGAGAAAAGVSVASTEGFVGRSAGGDVDVARLLKEILFFGTIWFLIFPCTTVLSMVLPPSKRKFTIASASLLIHAIVMCFLMCSFLLSSSKFFNASSLKNMGTIFAGGFGNASKGGFLRKAAFD